MLQYIQGFWKALSTHDDGDGLRVFSELLALCDEFSVTLDYNTPVSGGEWVVMVAHFGDRTTFRFPRLNFNARDVYNQLLQRLDKAKRKALQSEAAPSSKSEDIEVPAFTENEPVAVDPAAKDTGTSPTPTAGTEADLTEKKPESSDTTPGVTGESSKPSPELAATDSTGSESENSPAESAEGKPESLSSTTDESSVSAATASIDDSKSAKKKGGK